MCKKHIFIKNPQQSGITEAFVPCGYCVDCRAEKADAWGFRLSSEFLTLIKRGWNVAFCTLTYRNEDLPFIPPICFKDMTEFKVIPCFSRSDVQEWLVNIRQYLKRNFGMVKERRIRYFVASELGTLRHRPHYHVVLGWPPDLSYVEMHKICSDCWHHGYLFPRHPQGDKNMLPFQVVGDAVKCFRYIAKYVCKDLELDKLQTDIKFFNERGKYEKGSYEDSFYRTWKNCQSFHLQSRSLGFEALKNLSDEEKIKIYREGMSFSSDGKVYQVPIYIKNKLIFDPYYMYDAEGKRLVKRIRSSFFEKYKFEIFDKKAEFYQKYCMQGLSLQYWRDNGVSDEYAKKIVSSLGYYFKFANKCFSNLGSDNNFGKYYLAYNNVNPCYRYNVEPIDQWMSRYRPDRFLVFSDDYDFNCKLSWLDNYWFVLDSANAMIGSFESQEREKQEGRLLKALDFFNNITKG